MGDLPWWMGLAPLMGFLLDALLGGTRVEEATHGWLRRNLPRMEFVMRNAFGSTSDRAGYALAIWYAALAAGVAWLVSTIGFVIQDQYGLFVARSLLFVFLFSARRLTIRGIQSLAHLAAGDTAGSRDALRDLGRTTSSDDVGSLSGETVRGLSGGMLGAAFIPLFWGIGGAETAAAALAIHLVARFGRSGPPETEALYTGAARLDRWISWPAAWLGGLVLPLVIGVVGGRRTTAFATFMTQTTVSPEDRLAAALARGFGLGETAGGYPDGPQSSPSDVQKVVQVLFLAGMVAAAVTASIGALAFRLL